MGSQSDRMTSPQDSREYRTVGRLLEGRTAIVTGGGGGMGRGIVEAFADHGANVVIGEIDPATATGARESVEARGARGVAVVGDVRDRSDCERVVDSAIDEFGTIDILVNNVGHYGTRATKPFHETTEEEWEELHSINLLHVLRMTQVALPHMLSNGSGSIINVTTVEAHRAMPHRPVYGAYKAAVSHFTRSLAVDLGKYGIRVNELAPDMTSSIQLPLDTLLTGDEAASIGLGIPLGRLGTPADSAGVAVFLASDLSAYVTGSCVRQDGGTIAAGGWYRSVGGRREWTNMPRNP